ncbi:MAG: sigma-70 family RNA polymerase sigma factor [Acidobacteria bacterium]|nr:sigma-70 family RNA polymerase sigma factor [Acidobacteriota bacterium]
MKGVVDTASPARVSQWLDEIRSGSASALDRLIPVVYAELKRVAAAYMRHERPGQTLQPTALVHEAYLRLLRQRHLSWENRAHFLAIAAQLMRQILIERARAKATVKRGGGLHRVSLDERVTADLGHDIDVETLDALLTKFAVLDPGRARIVELRYFAGLTVEETAAVLHVAPATVKRGWAVARAWLRRALTDEADE